MNNKRKVNILLVDDQPANLAVLEAVLAELNEVLVSVTSGELALRQVLEQEFAVVLMDVVMPTMSGLETAAMLRNHPRARNLPIIFLTANHEAGFQVEQAYALGAVDFLTKPFNPVILRSKVAVFIDLHRKTAEIARHAQASHMAALRTRDERIRLILDNTRDYAFIGTDPNGIVTEWEGGAESITGWALDDARGQPSVIIFTPEDRADGRPEEELRQARDSGRAEDRRWHLRRDGTRFFADGVTVSLRDEQGQLRGYAKIFRDATAERLAAEQLEQSEAQLGESRQRSRLAEENLLRLAAVAEQSPDFIGIATPDGHQTYLNPAGRALTGVPPQADIAVYGIDDFFDGDSREHIRRTVLPAIRGAAGKWEGELCMRHLSSGATYPVYYKGFAVRNAEGVFIAIATITRDITEQKTAENALRRIAADLSEADRRKSEFLATLAHELRNPLAPIRSGLDLLRMSAGDAAASARIHAMMDRQLGHLVHLVNDLLDVARITRGKIALKKEACDLATIVAMAQETSAGMIAASGHTLTIAVPHGQLPVEVDITRMVQVVSNLLNNAAKYTPPGGRITLSAGLDAGTVVLAVTDSGVGIPTEAMATLFDMFTQVGGSMARSQGGLGIGLSLVQRLVQLHDGSVSAASAGPGQGSTFTVRLPLRRSGNEAQGLPTNMQTAVPASAMAALTPLRILVVDDNVDAADSLAALLGTMGHRARVAVDGPSGYALAREFAPQLAFLDIGMPGMSGHELARSLRATPGLPQLMLVALTGWGTCEDVAQSNAAGFDLHLTKPVDCAALETVFAALAQETT
jgi:PAS domain S-box-containing protein